MANTVAADWDEGSPISSEPRRAGATEIRSLRQAVSLRMAKEHVEPDAASVGGEHLEGSARVYLQAAAPTMKPDGVTALDSDDEGRLWLDSDDDYRAYVWSGSAWVDITPAPDPTAITQFELLINAAPTPSHTKSGLINGTYIVFVEGACQYTASGATLSIVVGGITKSIVLAAVGSDNVIVPFMLTFHVTVTGGTLSLTAVSSNVKYLTSMSGFLTVAS